MKAMYRYVTTMLGAQYVMITGELLIQEWYVINLDINLMVHIF